MNWLMEHMLRFAYLIRGHLIVTATGVSAIFASLNVLTIIHVTVDDYEASWLHLISIYALLTLLLYLRYSRTHIRSGISMVEKILGFITILLYFTVSILAFSLAS